MNGDSDNHAFLRWGLYAIAALGIGSCLLYTIENWRGRQTWKHSRAKLEAQGAVLDWERYIPAKVPDEQNCYGSTNLADWFVKKPSSANTAGPFTLDARPVEKAGPVAVADITFVGENPTNGAALRWGEPGCAEALGRVIREALGPSTEGATGSLLLAQPWEAARAARLSLMARTKPTSAELAKLLPEVSGATRTLGKSQSLLEVQTTEAGFRIWAKAGVNDAREHLRLSQRARDTLESLRPALARPLARMPGDYSTPVGRPVENFVALRSATQLLAERAQCHLLLGEPAAAQAELSLIRQLCHLFEAKPGSDCPTLVQAMIDVAITGLYAETIHEGLCEHRWGEPELAALQAELGQVNLLPLVRRAFEAGRAHDCWLFEKGSRDLERVLAPNGGLTLQKRLSDPTLRWLLLAPRGWAYQNMRRDSELYTDLLRSFDAEAGRVIPATYNRFTAQMQSLTGSPETFLVAIAMPNFFKAVQVCAANQTRVNQAYLACALERYRLAHGAYPESLETLRPMLAERLPHDLIGGKALHYVRRGPDHFLLYSVGWNERDEGGAKDQDLSKGDWVWEQ